MKKFDYVVAREVALPQLPFGSGGVLVLAGVPAPRDIRAGTCVAQMDGFRVNNVSLCFGEAREGIARLRGWPAAEQVANCRLLEPPESASLEAVSTYGPELNRPVIEQLDIRRWSEKPTPAPIDVRVEKAGDVVLVLNTYEPATWRVSPSSGTRIVGVLLIGYYTSTVEGIAPGTPVVTVDHEGRDRRPKPAPACAKMQSWMSTAHRGGPDAIVLDRQVQALTGHPLDGLRGADRLKQVDVR